MKKLKMINIAALYIGVIMGAGFASGREAWQFFGVFGSKGYIGTFFVTVGFIAVACMLSYIALSKNTSDLGRLISPVENSFIVNTVGIITAAIYYSMIIAMTAAGGSLLNQEFGINKAVGGAIIAILVVLTVLGDFERISAVFKLLTPVLFTLAVLTIIFVIRADFTQSGAVAGYKPGSMTPNWAISAIVFLAYNTIGMITMAGSSAENAVDRKNAFGGAILGATCLGALTIILLRALLSDMAFASVMDLPMLAFSGRISKVLNVVYAVVLYGAVYSTAASTYYGFSTKLPDNNAKKPVLVFGAIAGFGLGLTGFKILVEYLYPLQGYIGILFLILITINFINEVRKNFVK